MSSRFIGNLRSDWDGTGVEIVPKYDPRNWFKIGMPVRRGYLDFLRAAERQGFRFEDIVSVRKRSLRAPTTFLTIAYQRAADPLFEQQIQWRDFKFAGNERNKADKVVRGAAERSEPVVFLDDKPHNIGPELIQSLKRHAVSRTPGLADVTLAAVDHPKAGAYMERFLNDDRVPNLYEEHAPGTLTFNLGASAALHVVRVEPYSAEAAVHLAEQFKALPHIA
jgi:hypothetical protein